MIEFIEHVWFHLPIAAVATLLGALLCRFLPWRLGYVVVTGLVTYYVIVISLVGEGKGSVSHVLAYLTGSGLIIGLYSAVRSVWRARASRASDT